VIIFKLTKDSKLRTGASIRMNRNYSGKGGLYERLNYLQMRIDYFKSNYSDSVELNDTYLEYDRIKKMIPNTDSIDNNAYGLNLRARVTELYDSTGKATWQVNGKFLLERPKAGDLIYITN
jgi:CTP:phosphocholine cytidylyltransferase-like protein